MKKDRGCWFQFAGRISGIVLALIVLVSGRPASAGDCKAPDDHGAIDVSDPAFAKCEQKLEDVLKTPTTHCTLKHCGITHPSCARPLPRGDWAAKGQWQCVAPPKNELAITDPDKHEIVKVLPKLKTMKLVEGSNVIQATSTGENIIAQVHGGKISEWVVTDSKGQTLPSQTVQQKLRARRKIRCWHCYKNPETGEIHCFEIPCPF